MSPNPLDGAGGCLHELHLRLQAAQDATGGVRGTGPVDDFQAVTVTVPVRVLNPVRNVWIRPQRILNGIRHAIAVGIERAQINDTVEAEAGLSRRGDEVLAAAQR